MLVFFDKFWLEIEFVVCCQNTNIISCRFFKAFQELDAGPLNYEPSF